MEDKNPILVRLGQNIRAARKLTGLSQEEFAIDCGLDRTYIGGIERGERNVSVLNLCKIARMLGVTPAFCLEGLDVAPPADTSRD